MFSTLVSGLGHWIQPNHWRPSQKFGKVGVGRSN